MASTNRDLRRMTPLNAHLLLRIDNKVFSIIADFARGKRYFILVESKN